jgi:light-harvesting protein B-800-850 alpha chain
MIYGKMWLVVKPTVGIPLFFVGVMTASMLTHFAILTHTTWFPAFLNGKAKAKVSSVMTPDTRPPVVALLS